MFGYCALETLFIIIVIIIMSSNFVCEKKSINDSDLSVRVDVTATVADEFRHVIVADELPQAGLKVKVAVEAERGFRSQLRVELIGLNLSDNVRVLRLVRQEARFSVHLQQNIHFQLAALFFSTANLLKRHTVGEKSPPLAPLLPPLSLQEKKGNCYINKTVKQQSIKSKSAAFELKTQEGR